MQKRFRQLFTSLKEHTRVSYAKVATIGGFCDIDLIIVKATSPKDLPYPERYILELLKIFAVSPSSFRAFSSSFTRRFGKAQSWRVAVKCLILLHRLLRSLPDDSPFRAEILWARASGLLSLYPCHFRDFSSSASEEYTAFVSSYAHFLDESLNCIPVHSQETEDEPQEIGFSERMKELGTRIEILPQLQSLIDCAMHCWPSARAARSLIIQYAMKLIIRDSITCYTTFRTDIVMLLDNLIQLPYRSCLSAFSIYKKASVQANQLSEFYDWCKSMCFCGSYEYPFVDHIPELQIRALENFLNGMWQLTDQSSSSTVSLASTLQSPLSFSEDESDKQMTIASTAVNWERFDKDVVLEEVEKDAEMEPLIQWEGDENEGWEDLLDASISTHCHFSRNSDINSYDCRHGNYTSEEFGGQENGKLIQVYNYYALQIPNPYYQPLRTMVYTGSCPASPIYPWGL